MSAIAFAAGAANAQTNGVYTTNGVYDDANTGNRAVVSCVAGNVCSVTQTPGQTFSSTGAVIAEQGAGPNTSTVTQSGNRQYSENRTNGVRNSAISTQNGFNNTSTINQTGTTATGAIGNSATVTQGTAAAGNAGTGNNNISQVVQVRTAGAANSAGVNLATVNQGTTSGGFNNTAVLTQNGTNLTSTVEQQQTVAGNISASFNSATVSQTNSLGASSTVTQRSSGNTARVDMFGGNNTSNASPNGAATGANISTLTQNNTLFQTNATAGAFTAAAPTTTANTPRSGNSAIVAITGLQNNSTVSQDGVQNTVDQSMLTGGAGNTALAGAGAPTNPGTGAAFPANRPEGNSSTITQTGRGNYAATSIGGRVTTGGGSGNISSITQSQTDAAVTATTFNSTQTATTAHRAIVYQRGILDQVTINQSNNNLGGSAANTVQSGSLADVSQLSFNSTASVTQVGTNTGRITQGARNETTGASNVATIDQTDAGDITTTTGQNPGGGFGGGSGGTTTGTSRNFAEIAQSGIQNTVTLTQNGINASTTVFQAVGTRQNFATVLQGTGQAVNGSSAQQTAANTAGAGANTRNVVATVNQTAGGAGAGVQTGANVAVAGLNRGVVLLQNGQNLTARADQAGGTVSAGTGTQTFSNNAIAIAQAGTNSSATVTQSGTSLSANIEQRGANTDTARLNIARIDQTGTNNAASATQTATVTASTSTGATAGVPNDVNFPASRAGANSAEMYISQTGSGHSGTIEQRGAGQIASITQSGTNNVGGILQDTGATNAVALLNQSGTGNTYYITQTTAGQYVNVRQTGDANAMTSVVNGPNGTGNNQSATPTVRPAFGGQ